MVKVLGPLFSIRAWGTFDGTLVYQRRPGMPTVMRRRAPGNPNTEAQQSQRTSFAAAVSSWRVLPDASKAEWTVRAWGIGTTGYNLYMKNYLLGLL